MKIMKYSLKLISVFLIIMMLLSSSVFAAKNATNTDNGKATASTTSTTEKNAKNDTTTTKKPTNSVKGFANDAKGKIESAKDNATTVATTVKNAKDATTNAVKEPAEAIQDRGLPILNALVWFGYAIALGMVVFIGIKYMLGAADAKANMKSAMISWLIGALIVFMATTIVGWVFGVIGINKGDTTKDLANDIINSVSSTTAD